jgi:hypothetical protein
VTLTAKNGFSSAWPFTGSSAVATVRRVVRRPERVHPSRPSRDAASAAGLCEEPVRGRAGHDTKGVA